MTLIKSISGIRGTIGGKAGDNLTPIDVVKFVSAYVKFLSIATPKDEYHVVVGRDARVSGAMINNLVCSTLQGMGVHVTDIGLSTTPTVEMSVVHFHADGGIILTASHNPMQWNALKLLNSRGEFISGDEGRQLLQIAEQQDFEYATIDKMGSYTQYDRAIEDHIDAILKLDLVDTAAIAKADFAVALDCVHSTGGLALPRLLERLGVKRVTTLYGEPTGLFPHNPEPLPEHLTDIANLLKEGKHDIGFVVDPDVDRLALLTESGDMFGEEYTLVSVSDYVLQNTKGNTVSNLSSTRALRDVSNKHGVEYNAAAVGEVNVVTKMKETNAVIGGEGNGGVIYPALHYGRDALVGIALFLSFMAKTGKRCSEIRAQYPHYVMSKNKIQLSPEMNVKSILAHMADKYAQYDVNTIDGVKIDFPDRWVHLRSSNTEPIIRIYSEAADKEKADALAQKLMKEITDFVQNK